MPLRPKTKHRLRILFVVAIAIGLLLTGGLLLRARQIRHQLNVDRAAGMDAYRAHDWPDVITKLTPYITNKPDDAEVLLALAVAQMESPAADRGNLTEAIGYLRRYRDLEPAALDPQHRLLDLLRQTRQWDQVVVLSRQILSANPSDGPSMAALAMGLQVAGKPSEALEVSEKYNDLVPTDLDGHELTYVIMRSLKTPQQEMLLRAQQFENRFPTDPRMKLAEVIAYTVGSDASPTTAPAAGNSADATEAAQLEAREEQTLTAATANIQPPDAQFARQGARLLDILRRYADSLDLLSRAAAANLTANDPVLKLDYAQRLFEAKKDEVLVRFLSDLDPASAPVELTGLKTLALRNVQRTTDADLLVSALAAKSNDPQAAAWAMALQLPPAATLQNRLDALFKAAAADQSNGVIHFMLATALQEAQEPDLALEQSRLAGTIMSGWTAPHLLSADIFARRGNLAAAVLEADHALQTAKAAGDGYGVDPAVTKATVLFEYTQSRSDTAASTDLLKQITDFRQSHPQEAKTLPIYVQLLAESGATDQAKKAIADEIANPLADGGQYTMLCLAEVSRHEHLDMDQPLLDAAAQKFGVTPQLAFDRARQMVYSNGATVAAALDYLRAAAAAQNAKGQPWEWGLVASRFREDAHDSSAGKSWVDLGNAYPDNLKVQSDILDPSVAPSAWKDHAEFIATTIARQRALTGDWGLTWKIAQARWLLASGDVKSANDAGVLLSDILKHPSAAQRPLPHVLAAQAMEKLGNLNGAVSELSQAWLLSPGDIDIGYEFLRLNDAAGRYADAADAFDRLATLSLTPDSAERAAAIMFEQHEYVRAGDLLRKYDDPATLHAGLVGLLAMVDQRLGRVKEAGDLYLRLLDATDVPPIVCSSAADFFASVGDQTTAEKFITKLNGAPLSDADRKLKIAAYQEQYGTDQNAVNQLYLDAIALNKTNVGPVARYSGYLIRRQRMTDADATLAAGLKQWPDNIELHNLQSLAGALSTPAGAAELTPVAAELSAEPGNPATSELLAIVTGTKSAASPLNDRLNDLSRKYPTFYPTFDIAVRRLMAEGRADARSRAAELAHQAMDRFPDQPFAARLACVAEAELGHWTEALDAAQQWRQRAFQQPVDADWHIALCLINLGRAAEAVNRLDAYVIDARVKPDDPLNRQIIRTYLAALIAAHRVDDAESMLRPLAASSASWRAVWLELGTQSFTDAEQAGKWINDVVPLIPAQNSDEMRLLAQSWFDLATRFGYARAYENCRDLLRSLVAGANSDASLLLKLAMSEDQTHDPAAADDYRRVLAASTRPTTASAAAANNLANLLMAKSDPAGFPEAEKLANQAIAQSANDLASQPYYFDTLGRVYLLESKPDLAADQFAKADQLLPNNPAILIGWADALSRSKKMDQAVVKLQSAQAHLAPPAKLNADIQHELDNVRQAVDKAAQQ